MTERRPAVLVTAALSVGAIAGSALGVMWWSLAPRVALVVEADRTYPETYQPREWITADVVFTGLAVAAGIVATIALARMRRGHLVDVLGASVLAGGVGSLVMRAVGERLGSVDIAGLQATLTESSVVEGPLRLTMTAALLAWPITASAVVLAIALGDVIAGRRSSSRDVPRD